MKTSAPGRPQVIRSFIQKLDRIKFNIRYEHQVNLVLKGSSWLWETYLPQTIFKSGKNVISSPSIIKGFQASFFRISPLIASFLTFSVSGDTPFSYLWYLLHLQYLTPSVSRENYTTSYFISAARKFQILQFWYFFLFLFYCLLCFLLLKIYLFFYISLVQKSHLCLCVCICVSAIILNLFFKENFLNGRNNNLENWYSFSLVY